MAPLFSPLGQYPLKPAALGNSARFTLGVQCLGNANKVGLTTSADIARYVVVISGGTHKGKQWLGPYGEYPNDRNYVLTDPDNWQGQEENPYGPGLMREMDEITSEEAEEEEKEEQQQIVKDADKYDIYPYPPNPCPDGYFDSQGCDENVPDTAVFSKAYQMRQRGREDVEHNVMDSYLNQGMKLQNVRAKKAPMFWRK